MTDLPIEAPTARLPDDGAFDVSYVEAEFRPLSDTSAALVKRGLLPQATYVLPDGTPMVPPDHAQLLADAGGRPDAVEELFRARYAAAGGDVTTVDEDYTAWLSGEYGACLYATTPENIVAKSALMAAIEALKASASPQDERWCGALRGAVDALDSIERPFADYDRDRFDGPTSRDRLITAARQQFPAVFS